MQVRRKVDGKIYALKVLKKESLASEDQVRASCSSHPPDHHCRQTGAHAG